MAFRVANVDRAVEHLEKRGIPMLQKAKFGGKPFAYVDAGATLGTVLELMSRK